jgi:hypothetical protein
MLLIDYLYRVGRGVRSREFSHGKLTKLTLPKLALRVSFAPMDSLTHNTHKKTKIINRNSQYSHGKAN